MFRGNEALTAFRQSNLSIEKAFRAKSRRAGKKALARGEIQGLNMGK